jgi:phosphohistidine phosphatase SixA
MALLAALSFAQCLALPGAVRAQQPGPKPTDVAVQGQQLPGLDTVLDELRRGGLVIYFRHGLTDLSGPKDDQAEMPNCDTQRNLSAAGREQFMRIGSAFRHLGIPVGTVSSSPFCRCKDSSRLAFGSFVVNPDLYFALGTDATQTRRLTDALRRQLSTPPAAGTNTILVAHSANLLEAAGIWPKPEGIAYVFRPLPGGRFEPLAKVAAEDWPRAAARRQGGAPH